MTTEKTSSEERIGPYRVHPVASMFPLIEGEWFEKFVGSIESHGQLQPIIVQGDVLIDGRNRLRACIHLGIEPRVEEYSEALPPARYIIASNLQRRDLSKEQRVTIHAKAIAWLVAERKRQAMLSGKSADGMAGGRGRKKQTEVSADTGTTDQESKQEQKNPNPNSGSGLPKRDIAEMHARSTAGEIAAACETTRYQAEQALEVVKETPELAEEVIQGRMPLKQAAKQAKEAKKKKAPAAAEKKRARKPPRFNADRQISLVLKYVRTAINKCPQDQRPAFVRELREHLSEL